LTEDFWIISLYDIKGGAILRIAILSLVQE
jgi:hypothetical protein